MFAIHLCVCISMSKSIINQTSIASISLAKPGSVMRQPNQCSTEKSRKQSLSQYDIVIISLSLEVSIQQGLLTQKILLLWVRAKGMVVFCFRVSPNCSCLCSEVWWSRTWPGLSRQTRGVYGVKKSCNI